MKKFIIILFLISVSFLGFTGALNYPPVKVKNVGILDIVNINDIKKIDRDIVERFIFDFEYELKGVRHFHIYDKGRLTIILKEAIKGKYLKEDMLNMLIRPEYLKKENSIRLRIYTLGETNYFSYKIGEFPEVNSVVGIVKKILPLEGEVVERNRDYVLINLGSKIGLEKGQLLNFVSDNKNGIGLFEIVDLYEDSSHGKILKTIDKVDRGIKVRNANYKLISDVNNQYLNIQPEKKKILETVNKRSVRGIKERDFKIVLSNRGGYFLIVGDKGIWLKKIGSPKTERVFDIKPEEVLDLKFSQSDDLVSINTYNYGLFIYYIPEGYLYQLNLEKLEPGEGYEPKYLFDKWAKKEYKKSVLDCEWLNKEDTFLVFIKSRGVFRIDPGNLTVEAIDIDGIEKAYYETDGADLLIHPDDRNLFVSIKDNIKEETAGFIVDLWNRKDDSGLTTHGLVTLPGVIGKINPGRLNGLITTPDCRYFVLFNEDGEGLKFQDVVFPGIVKEAAENIAVSDLGFSDDNRFIYFNSKTPILYDVKKGERFSILGGKIVKKFFLFPNTHLLFLLGIFKDVNNDGRLDWEDYSGIGIYNVDSGEFTVLLDNVDDFYGISSSGRNIVYRKSDRLYVEDIRISEEKFLKFKPQISQINTNR